MKSYKQFLEFVSVNYRTFIFTAVFYSLWLAYKNAITFDPQLLSFPGRMIGEATLNAYDINKRINVFYTTGLIFFLSLLFFSFISWRAFLFSGKMLTSSEARILNYSSLAGMIFYFFNLWTHSFDSSFELIYCIHKLAIAGFIIKWWVLKDKPVNQVINLSFYSIALITGVSLFFILTETAVLFYLFPKPDLLVTLFITAVILIIGASFFLRNKSVSDGKNAVNRFAVVIIPIVFIPLFSFLKDEIYLILNRHQMYFFSPRKLYVLLLLGVAAIAFLRYKKFKKYNWNIEKNNEQLVALRYFPLFILSITTFTFYSPFAKLSNEMFEAGNVFLPIMEFQKFGVIPVFEKFNAHVVSELFFESIYTFFNGLHGRELYIYDFILQVFWAYIIYRLVLKIANSAYIALFAVLFFPLINLLLADNTIISLLALFATYKVLNEQASFKNYFLLICSFVFLVLWRVDIGYPSVIASCITMFVFLVNREQFSINWKLFLKALAFFAAIFLMFLLAISWYRHINVFEKLWSGLNYLSSAQTYGMVSIGDATASVYKIQYFTFPLIMILLVSIMLVSFKKYTVSGSQRFIYASLLFLAVYYFVNFQRGLVRHGFIEGNDNRLSSYVFFIFSGSVFLFWKNKSKIVQLLAFVIISTFLIMNYKFPVPGEFKNIYSTTAEKIANIEAIEPHPGIVRYNDTTHYEEGNFGEFKKLVSKKLSDKQTFIDFSNMPMLYYYTGKISPSYFYQNPLTIHNDYLQKKFIDEVSSYNAPLIVFSNFPENWWDNVDGVPNTIRHYRLAEYFYQNYRPFVIVDNLCVWKRKNADMQNNQQTVFSDAQSDSLIYGSIIRHPVKPLDGKKYLLAVNFENDLPEIHLRSIGLDTILKPDFNNEINHTAYYIIKNSAANFAVEYKKSVDIRSVELTASDFIPDFYSEHPQRDAFMQLPYVWATYDKTIAREKTLLNLFDSTISLKEDEVHYFNFIPTLDKTSGNTIFISLEAYNDEPLSLELMYGGVKEVYKGSFQFTLPAGAGSRSFAIRISSQYNWYDHAINYIALVSKSTKEIRLKKLKILKAQ